MRAPMSDTVHHLIDNYPDEGHKYLAALRSGCFVRLILEDGTTKVHGPNRTNHDLSTETVEPEDIVVIDLRNAQSITENTMEEGTGKRSVEEIAIKEKPDLNTYLIIIHGWHVSSNGFTIKEIKAASLDEAQDQGHAMKSRREGTFDKCALTVITLIDHQVATSKDQQYKKKLDHIRAYKEGLRDQYIDRWFAYGLIICAFLSGILLAILW